MEYYVLTIGMQCLRVSGEIKKTLYHSVDSGYGIFVGVDWKCDINWNAGKIIILLSWDWNRSKQSADRGTGLLAADQILMSSAHPALASGSLNSGKRLVV